MPQIQEFIVLLFASPLEVGKTGEYLAAASLPAGRKRNCGQLLTWAAMLHLKALGFHVLDIGGFDPQDDESGVSHFKRGTNAVPYRLCSEIDAHSSGMKRSVIRRAIALGRTPVKIPLLASGRASPEAAGSGLR